MNLSLLVPRLYRRYFAKFYAYPDSDPTAMLRAPWATSLHCHGAFGVPTATLRHVSCDARATCFRGYLTALVLSMFKTWRWPLRPWRPYCNLQRCHGALWDLATTQRRSAAIWPILQIAARSPSCVTGVLSWTVPIITCIFYKYMRSIQFLLVEWYIQWFGRILRANSQINESEILPGWS